VLTIEKGGIDYVTTGGHIDDIVGVTETAKQTVIAGTQEWPLRGVMEIRLLADVLDPDQAPMSSR
jgi:hypothetical protein